MSDQGRRTRTLRTRALAAAIACGLGLAALELASFVLFYAAAGRRFSYKEIALEQASTGRLADAAEIPAAAAAAVPESPPDIPVPSHPEHTPEELVPHPFTGFVLDPQSTLIRQLRHHGGMDVTELGFLRFPEPAPGGNQLSVAVFGGSVAAYLCADGAEGLKRGLGVNTALAAMTLHLECFALGGFKQPQMAGTLTYLSSLGRRFDVVIELDGFNEVAVPFTHHRTQGLFPFYPRAWDTLVSAAPDLDTQRRVGIVSYLQDWRGRVARRFARRPLSWSVTAGLLWKCVDRWLSSELARARQQLETARTRHSNYREKGPLREYGSPHDFLADMARVWGLSSLQMHRLCAGAGTHYHHFLQPNQYVPGSKPMSAAERTVAYRDDHPYRVPVEQGYPLLQAEGARLAGLGVDFHDLTALYAGVEEPLYKDDCCHVNVKGSTILGEAIGRAAAARWKH